MFSSHDADHLQTNAGDESSMHKEGRLVILFSEPPIWSVTWRQAGAWLERIF